MPALSAAAGCAQFAAAGVNAHSTMAFAAIGDHARLPSRFFGRLFASDGSLASG
jgi:hypothetical protein